MQCQETQIKGYNSSNRPQYWLNSYNPPQYWLNSSNPTQYWLNSYNRPNTD